MNKIKELVSMAKAVRACKPELRELGRARTDGDLYRVFWDNVIFCVAHDFPDYRWILGYMPDAAENGIFVNKHVKELPPVAVVLGASMVEANATGYDQCRYWLRQQSSISISVSGRSLVVIDLYDEASAHIVIRDKALVKVYKYGKNQVTIIGNEGKVDVIKKSLNAGK